MSYPSHRLPSNIGNKLHFRSAEKALFDEWFSSKAARHVTDPFTPDAKVLKKLWLEPGVNYWDVTPTILRGGLKGARFPGIFSKMFEHNTGGAVHGYPATRGGILPLAPWEFRNTLGRILDRDSRIKGFKSKRRPVTPSKHSTMKKYIKAAPGGISAGAILDLLLSIPSSENIKPKPGWTKDKSGKMIKRATGTSPLRGGSNK
jgi:hypothetical protein